MEKVFGITPDLLNDDRLARALDAIAPKREAIAGTVGARTITEFGIDSGSTKDRRLAVSADGGAPVHSRVVDGAAAEAGQVLAGFWPR
ncbi:hypothetical protein [Streptomyces sp. D54]|uniref:hypothetical protein n=1 Tax=Streptomyces sp. D54 TaxID=1290289 RepID=UPI003CE88AED